MDQSRPTASEREVIFATTVVEFSYKETKELATQFLTVIVGVLALSITFGEKIVNFNPPRSFPQTCLITSWILSLLAFFFGGCGIFCIFQAGSLAKYTVAEKLLHPFKTWLVWSYRCLMVAGALFVNSLLCLVITGIAKLK